MKKKESQSINPIMEDKKIFKSCNIEKVVPGGDGLVRIDGKVFFIPGVLPGEIIDFEVEWSGKKFSRGVVTKIIKPSEKRVKPFCEYYGQCGGCNLQHMDYNMQLQIKESFVREHYQRIAGITLPDDFTFISSREQHYRNRVQFHRTASGPGFKMRSSEKVIPLKHCPILVESLNHFLAQNRGLNRDRETFFGYKNELWRESQPEKITVELNSKQVHFSADLFFQSNLSVLPDLLNFALQGLSGEHAMDLYCGVGLFSIFLKDLYNDITAIELNHKTEPFYRMNMEGARYEYFGISLEQWLRTNKKKHTDLIVLDPPRTGLSEKVRAFLSEASVHNLVYVSCDPVTQARDAKDLISAGYQLTDIRGFDFYPQTNHMETVCRFKKP